MKMFTTLAFIALISLASALSPASIANGFNHGLGLQSNQKINQCIYTFMMNSKAQSEFLRPTLGNNMDLVCYEAALIYLQAFVDIENNAQKENGPELTGMLALTNAIETVKNLKRNSNFEAGESAAKALKYLATSISQAKHARLAQPNGSVNWTAVALGFNAQLSVTDGDAFGVCLDDSASVELIIKAAIIAINHKDVIHSVEDIMKLIQHLPGLKKECKDCSKAYETLFAKIDKAYNKDQQAFFGLVESNLEKQPLKVTKSLAGFFDGLKTGNDLSAGQNLGVLFQTLLAGII